MPNALFFNKGIPKYKIHNCRKYQSLHYAQIKTFSGRIKRTIILQSHAHSTKKHKAKNRSIKSRFFHTIYYLQSHLKSAVS